MSGRAQCGAYLELGVYQCRKAQGFSKKFTRPNDLNKHGYQWFFFGWRFEISIWIISLKLTGEFTSGEWAFCTKNKGSCSNHGFFRGELLVLQSVEVLLLLMAEIVPALGFEMEKNTPTMHG